MHANIRGGAPVGHVADLDPLEAAVVFTLRLWCESPNAQQQVWNDFAATLGSSAAREAVSAIEDFCRLCERHGRRVLMRHRPSCDCVGADEACLANLVAQATEGEREDALLIATLLVRPDVGQQLAEAARTFGLALRRMALKADRQATAASSNKLH